MKVYSVIKGKFKSIESVADEMFSKKILGEGVAIEPSSNVIVSPCDGEIIMSFPTKHAIGIKTKYGNEILIHIGVDTVELNGRFFEQFVKQGDKVKTGDTLCVVNFSALKNRNYITDVIVISTNSKIKINEKIDIVDESVYLFEL